MRENGFYWATFHTGKIDANGIWQEVKVRSIAEYFNGTWLVTGVLSRPTEGNEITDISDAKITE